MAMDAFRSLSELDQKKSPWRSIWISIGMQFIVGVQTSIYYMSMWPYLSSVDRTATVDFLGWVIAACSLGCSVANPLFGLWNQKTMSIKAPVIVGMIMMIIGQGVFGILPLFNSGQKWIMLSARLLTGIGAGTLSVLRAYAATASTPRDRLSSVSFGTAGYVLGLSFGPAIQGRNFQHFDYIRLILVHFQAVFTPVGERGFRLGSIIFNMYTMPAFFMVLLSIVCCIIIKLFFKEEYAGIIEKKQDEGKNFMVIPKFDMVPAVICIYLWMVSCMVATNIEVLVNPNIQSLTPKIRSETLFCRISTPWSVVMYNWKDSDAVLYNGIFQTASCLVSSGNSFLIGYTRIGQIEKRKQILFGITVFLLFHIFNFPWPFYAGPLDYIPEGKDSSEVGGCLPSYKWCESTVRVPFPIYMICFVFFFGVSFPFTGSPSATLYSQILGPRKQVSVCLTTYLLCRLACLNGIRNHRMWSCSTKLGDFSHRSGSIEVMNNLEASKIGNNVSNMI
ncbi:unnamed protein product [Haemonchus placei]|uniref:MFS domain-containing protein n=1 Tax=Haemonchus placei TaxID=6290 RepID=A0A0N4WRI9_HAEPC|nr:unnamed protein product [Haemonchus placei]